VLCRDSVMQMLVCDSADGVSIVAIHNGKDGEELEQRLVCKTSSITVAAGSEKALRFQIPAAKGGKKRTVCMKDGWKIVDLNATEVTRVHTNP
jgi:hypothetical protein